MTTACLTVAGGDSYNLVNSRNNKQTMTSAEANLRFETTIATMRERIRTRKTNPSYVREYVKYCEWCRDELPHEATRLG